MKKINPVPLIIFCFALIKSSFAQELKTEKIAEFNIHINRPIIAGSKLIYTVTDGTSAGIVNGKFLPVAGDFATLIAPANLKIDVRIVLQTEDSSNIYITYSGYVYADAETFKLLASGKGYEADPSKYYFRISPVFETTSKKYEWLNHTVAVGIGTVIKGGVNYKVYAIK